MPTKSRLVIKKFIIHKTQHLFNSSKTLFTKRLGNNAYPITVLILCNYKCSYTTYNKRTILFNSNLFHNNKCNSLNQSAYMNRTYNV